jgi:hypothetical protein
MNTDWTIQPIRVDPCTSVATSPPRKYLERFDFAKTLEQLALVDGLVKIL